MTEYKTKTEAAQVLIEAGNLTDEQIMAVVSCSKTTVDNARKTKKASDNIVYAIGATLVAVCIYLAYLI